MAKFLEIVSDPVKKVIEEKVAIRKLSQDEETIKNRVRLLKTENEKMLKKISEANSRAEKIFEAKMRNEQIYLERMRQKQEKDTQILALID